MKKLFLTLLLMAFSGVFVRAQGCLPEGISFTSQSQIDNFQTNYLGCTEIEGDVIITGEEINNLNGLNILTAIDGSLSIVYNSLLTGLFGLGQLTSVGNDLSLTFLGGLFNLSGLDNLTTVGGSLFIGNNASLNNLSGLENLNFIGGGFTIQDNDALTGLSEFGQIASLGGDLGVSYNDALTSLDGLENIDAGTVMNIQIIFNTQLSFCHIQSICDYLANPNGTILIIYNSPGCNSLEEVQQACLEIGVEELQDASYLVPACVYPNPADGLVTIEYLLEEEAFVGFSILDHLGRQVALLVNETQGRGKHKSAWDASTVPSGIYYLRIQAGNQLISKKIIKMN